jgi:hypothetical protein
MCDARSIRLFSAIVFSSFALFHVTTALAKTEVFESWTTFRDDDTGDWYAVTTSEKNEGVFFGISFDPSAGCEPLGLYSVPSASALDRQDDGAYQKTLKFRVDDATTWIVDKGDAILLTTLSMNRKFAVAALYLPISDEFIAQLIDGAKLRMLTVESDITDRFDLKGSKVAVAMAQLGCLQETSSIPEKAPNDTVEPPPVKTTHLNRFTIG